MEQLEGRVAFITGGASGIGLGMGKAFLAEGMKVALADWSDDHIAKAKAARSVAEKYLTGMAQPDSPENILILYDRAVRRRQVARGEDEQAVGEC